ncbi:MAG: prepilin-type N-terminal cleavage/methylation domain-containing protein [Planctomycetota bacterium]
MPRRAFTLIELLVVIGIIALLVALLLPTLGRAKSAALFLGCQTNMRSIGQAVRTFALDNNGRKPPAAYRLDRGKWISQAAGPNTRMDNRPFGLGVLVDQDYLVFEALQDHGRNMALDREIDLEKWRTSRTSGSSYLYFYRNFRETTDITDPLRGFPKGDPTSIYTLDHAADMHQHALVSDVNLDDAVGYTGAFEGGVPWVSHPEEGRSNFLFLDGSVGTADNNNMVIAGSADDKQRARNLQVWFDAAHRLYDGR